jgi:hypothetical protein
MIKKVCCILVASIMVSLSGLTVFAAPDEKAVDKLIDEVYDKATLTSEKQFLVKITKPEDNKIFTSSSSYTICGQVVDKDADIGNLKVSILKKSSDKNKYEPYRDENGEMTWKIGELGLFMKQVQLKEGINDIRAVIYKESEKDNLQINVNLQLTDFVIISLNEENKVSLFVRFIDIASGKYETRMMNKNQ